MRRATALTTLACAAAVALSGCGDSSSTSAGSTSSGSASSASTTTSPSVSASAITGEVDVSAAASLTETFKTLAGNFEKAHPGVKVVLNFGGSDALATQITGGAPVDVFAAASTKTMTTVTAAGDATGQPTVFAKNALEIAVPPSNPAKVTSLADTAKPGVKLVLCAPAVPCGAAAAKAYAAATLVPHPVSLEQDVKSVLTKVELNEADAGMVYQTDVRAAGSKVVGVSFPESAQAIASYPIAAVKHGKNTAGGAAFIAYVLSPAGTAALKAAGFLAP